MDKLSKWRKLSDEQQKSGKTVAQFCRESGIRESQWQYWRARLESSQEAPGKFVRVGDAAQPIEIVISERVRMLLPAGTSAEDIRKFLETANALNS